MMPRCGALAAQSPRNVEAALSRQVDIQQHQGKTVDVDDRRSVAGLRSPESLLRQEAAQRGPHSFVVVDDQYLGVAHRYRGTPALTIADIETPA